MTVNEALPGVVERTLDDMVVLGATMSRSERRALGAARRGAVPLENHAEAPDASGRPDALELLTAQDQSRLPELVPIRHGRMSASAFAFYRGAAAVMASDLSTVPSSGVHVQLCGDAHLANFGLFNGPDRRLVIDVNDFDETLPGPFEWDVKRLAASMVVAARNNGLSDEKVTAAALAAVRRYREVMTQAARVDPLDLHYFRLEFDDVVARLGEDGRGRTKKLAEKAKQKNRLKALDKLTQEVDGRRRIVHDPPLVIRFDAADATDHEDIRTFLDQYLESLPLARRLVLERYRLIDIAHKVVGVGSVGTRCFIALFETGDGEPLFLQLKEATTSVLEPYVGASQFAQAGQRVVEGQRLMQATGDVFLGWARFHRRLNDRTIDLYVRQLWDGKASVEVDRMGGRRLALYGEVCGGTLALAHARTGDAAIIAGYLGDDDTFDRAVATFANAYADLTELDHERHVAAIADGQIAAMRDI